jgi:hypothetical protein
MNRRIFPSSVRHKELADKLRGNLSYDQHYGYLLDWYMNDRNGWKPDGKPQIRVKARRRGNIFTKMVNK